MHGSDVFLESITLKKPPKDREAFPFNTPLMRTVENLRFRSPVTFLVGENGTGKSLLLEAIAAGLGWPAAGGAEVDDDPTLDPARALGERLRFSFRRRAKNGFFFRAEDFFNFTQRMKQTAEDLEATARDYEERFSGTARMLAVGSVMGQREAIVSRYGENLDANSHGEAFLHFFRERLHPNGMHLIDEPEAALSPQRQYALLFLMHDVVAGGAQFIVATHSPVLMAYPGATILDFDEHPARETAYQDLEHVRFLRSFLEAPERYLRELDN